MAIASKGEFKGRSPARDVAAALAGAALVAGAMVLKSYLCPRNKRRRVLAVLPARYESTRFPGKPLVPIAGVPMVVRTYRRAAAAQLVDAVVVATDDERVAAVCREAGARVVMTPAECPNGTERCRAAAAALELAGERYDVVVNVQGDEPLIEPEVIDAVVAALRSAPEAVQSTAATPIRDVRDVAMTQRVKCVLDQQDNAIYFSRGALPSNKEGVARKFPEPWADKPYLLHLGIQCYDRCFLDRYCEMEPTPLMMMEDLEQLKVIENGYKIKVVQVDHSAHGVDLPEDVASIEAILRQQEAAQP